MQEDLQGFVNLWERILKDSQDFGRGFARITEDLEGFVKTLGEDLQVFVREFGRVFARL